MEWKKNTYRRVLLTVMLLFFIISSNSFAAAALQSIPCCDLYLAGQFGYVDTHLKNKIDFYTNLKTWEPLLVSNSGLAARAAIGVQMNPYFALEAGYLDIIGNRTYKADMNTTLESRLNLQQTVYDMLAKVNKPFADYFNVYGKLGLAYLTTTLTNRFTQSTLPEYSFVIHQARRKWAPEIGLGVSYHLISNVLLDLSWAHIQLMGANKPGNIDFLAAGFTIYF